MKLEIELKAKPGDDVWVMYENRPEEVFVRSVYISYIADNVGGLQIMYRLDKVGTVTENKIFLTKYELINSLR